MINKEGLRIITEVISTVGDMDFQIVAGGIVAKKDAVQLPICFCSEPDARETLTAAGLQEKDGVWVKRVFSFVRHYKIPTEVFNKEYNSRLRDDGKDGDFTLTKVVLDLTPIIVALGNPTVIDDILELDKYLIKMDLGVSKAEVLAAYDSFRARLEKLFDANVLPTTGPSARVPVA